MPDTSEIPVLPNSSTYAPGRNPRVRGRSAALELSTPRDASPSAPSRSVPEGHITRHSDDATTLAPIHANFSGDYASTTTDHPHLDIQPETPLPVSSTEDTPMPSQSDDATPPRVYHEPDTPWASREPDIPADIPQQFVPSPPTQVPRSREESNMSTGDAILPPSITPPWFDETPPPPSTTHDETSLDLRPLRSKRLHQSQLHMSSKLRPFHPCRSVGDPVHSISRLLFQSKRLQARHSDGGVQVSCVSCARPFRSYRETTSIGSSSGDVDDFGEKQWWSLGVDEGSPLFDG